MNLWRLLGIKFIWVRNKDATQREITRLVDLGFSLLQGGNYVEARGLLLRAFQHESKIENPALLKWILMSLAETWLQTEEYQEWTTFFSDFISRNPNHALALKLRADSLWYGGRPQEAIADYARSLELKPNHAPALSGRGQVLMECGQFGRALEDLDNALNSIEAVEGADANWKARLEAYIRNGRAATYAGLGEFTRALEEFNKSISLCPENAWVYFNRAEAFRKQGDQVNAAENYRLSLAKKQPKLNSLKRAHAQKMLNTATL